MRQEWLGNDTGRRRNAARHGVARGRQNANYNATHFIGVRFAMMHNAMLPKGDLVRLRQDGGRVDGELGVVRENRRDRGRCLSCQDILGHREL